jgi:hypothetical protein
VPTEVFRVESRRVERAKKAQMAQHVIAAVALISTAWSHLQHGMALLPVLELLAGAVLIGAAMRDRVRHWRGTQHHEAVGWVEIAGAAMTFVEALAKTRERHHLSFLVLQFVQPVILLMFGVFDVYFASKRAITVDDHGIEMRLRLFFWRRLPWESVHGFQIIGQKVRFELPEGRSRTFNLRDLKNRDAAIEWLGDQLRRRGVDELPAPEQLPAGEGDAAER